MPPTLALVLTLLLIMYLFGRDFRQQYTPSLALSIPCFWMLILGSRSTTEWLSLGGPMAGGGDIAEGSPLDRAVYFSLMLAGIYVLMKRRISWSQVFRNNSALILFMLYCGISVTWSDLPFVAFKRWTKAFGDPIMVLILLTDRDPLRAAEILLRSCTNILVPLSVLFIKYYPHLGRGYSDWTGQVAYTGVTTNKNLLGFVLMVCGLSLVWRLYSRWGDGSGSKLDNVGIPLLLLGMVVWLFSIVDSKTSLMGFILGVVIFIALGRKSLRRHPGMYLIAGVALFALLEASFNMTEVLIVSTGRDATLTGRIELWDRVLKMQQHPILGFGFESFWFEDRLKKLRDIWFFMPTQAHNGYIEMYLNLGYVGLLFFSGVIVSCFLKLREMLVSTPAMTERVMWGRFGTAFLGVYLVYNYTEAAFKSPHFLFVIFLLFAIKASELQQGNAPFSSTGSPRSSQEVSRVSGGRAMVPAQ